MTVVRSLTVYFYAIEPFPLTDKRDFEAGSYPLESVLGSIRASDPATEEYRIRENLFGGETFCLVHDDGPEPILGAYYRDNLAAPLTEYKGEINELILRDGEALVDAAYMAFFPDDVVGLVRTSAKAPGFAKIGQWLSFMSDYGCGLVSLRDPNVLAQLDREPSKLRKLVLRIRRNRIAALAQYSPSIAGALRAAADVNSHSDEVGIELAVRTQQERAMWARSTRQEIEELLAVLPDFEKASVSVSGRQKPFNLLRASIQQPVSVLLANKRVTANEAAQVLFQAYDEERNSIRLAIDALRGSSSDSPDT
jgi:hypothetical protein